MARTESAPTVPNGLTAAPGRTIAWRASSSAASSEPLERQRQRLHRQRGHLECVGFGSRERDRGAGEGQRARDVVVAIERAQQQPRGLVVAGPAGRVGRARAVGERQQPPRLVARVRAAAGGQHAGRQHARARGQELEREHRDPALDRRGTPAARERQVVLLEQLRHRLGVAAGRGLLDGLLDQPVGAEPGRRAPVQRHRRRCVEPCPQVLAEQRLVAVPLAFLVERDQEQVLVGDALEQLRRIGGLTYVVAEAGEEPREHGGLGQERAQVVVEPGEDLAREVVRDVGLATADLIERPAGGPHPQRGEVQSDAPALGPLHERFELVIGELDPFGGRQQFACLITGERELGRPQLGERAVCAPARQRQLRVGAGDQDQADAVGQRPDRMGDRRQAARAGDLVEVVEDDGQRAAVVGELGGQHLDRRLRGIVGSTEPPSGAGADASEHLLDARDDVAPQAHRVLVVRVERHPRRRRTTRGEPRGDRDRLAVAGRGGDERDRGRAGVVEQLVDARARDGRAAQARWDQLAADRCLRGRCWLDLHPRWRLSHV